MSDKMPPPPALPNPEVYRVRWLTGPDEGWSQWHDEVDPLPSSWDEAPPDEVKPYYSAAQVQDIARAYAAQRVAPLVDALRYFAAYAEGENQGHLYEGDCPDQSQPDSRDPACPACKAMEKARAARAALAAEKEQQCNAT